MQSVMVNSLSLTKYKPTWVPSVLPMYFTQLIIKPRSSQAGLNYFTRQLGTRGALIVSTYCTLSQVNATDI